MGAKYTTQAVAGWNASPPADDGSATDSNKVRWATIRDKLSAPLNTWAAAVDAALLTALDYSVTQKTLDYTTVAGDHMRTVEIAPTVSSAVTISLGDAATMTSGYITRVKNSSGVTCTLTRITGGDTLDGAAASMSLAPGAAAIVEVNAGATGYLVLASHGVKLTGTYTPTWGGSVSNPTLGNGTNSGRWTRDGSMVDLTINTVFGTTTVAGSGIYSWSLPFPAKTTLRQKGVAEIFDVGTGYFVGVVNAEAGTTVSIRTNSGDVGATSPMSFTTGDKVDITIRYEIA